jgi:hypothetical protein
MLLEKILTFIRLAKVRQEAFFIAKKEGSSDSSDKPFGLIYEFT